MSIRMPVRMMGGRRVKDAPYVRPHLRSQHTSAVADGGHGNLTGAEDTGGLVGIFESLKTEVGQVPDVVERRVLDTMLLDAIFQAKVVEGMIDVPDSERNAARLGDLLQGFEERAGFFTGPLADTYRQKVQAGSEQYGRMKLVRQDAPGLDQR